MFVHNIDPVLLRFFGLEIRYYGLIFVLGFLFVLWYLTKYHEKAGLTKDDVYDFMIWLLVGVFIGARLGEVIFYNLGYYLDNPSQIIAFWRGGLSFHGGLIGAVIVGYYFYKKRNFDFYKMADIVVVPLALALAFGRLANFINGELYGTITTLPWAVKFPGVEGFRHPSQLYEILKNLVIFFTLWKIKDKKFKKGFLFWLFITMYGFIRTFVHFVRVPTTTVFGISVGQLFSFAMFIIGLYILLTRYRKK